MKNLLYLLAFILVTVIISKIAYSDYILRTEEGLVYESLFEPNPEVIEFTNIIALSQPSICQSSKLNYKNLPEEPVTNFIKVNGENSKPIRLTTLEGKVPIVSWEDTKSMHEKGITLLFRPEDKRFLKLSRVGFNKQKTNAIACIEISENMYGEGILVFLEKKKNKWIVIKDKIIWQS